jgi:2-amino-4-hydroxy-6-hydroxymethyldihydropteridine diphosphokinase
MAEVFLSIGSNIEREKNIASAVESLQERFGRLTLSSVYDTEAVGFEGAPFYNMVVGFESDVSVVEIVKILKEIEMQHGRQRISEKFSARALDLDLILYGDLILNEEHLQLPRPELMNYAFMLEPLSEVAPELRHPVTKERFAELWERFDKTDLRQKRVATQSM